MLVVLNLQCSPDLHGCTAGGTPDISLFDISDRRAPRLLSTYQAPLVFGARVSAHEMFVWRDPARPERVLVYATVGPSIHILDATQRVLTPVLTWNPVRDGRIDGSGANNDVHSVGVSDDGRVGYISHQTGGLVVVDTSDLAGRRSSRSIHSHDPATCANLPTATAYTAHNATTTRDLALVSWYAGGLQAIDVSDPAQPRQLAEIRPTQDFAVEHEDVVLAAEQIEMWSYPIVKDGAIYVVDVRNGLYVVEYTGTYGEQIRDAGFLEGNSNLR